MEYNKVELIQELSNNCIEYAAAVNEDRAIPDATSGLKPVARRIIYGAYDSGRSSSKPHVKCANIVGDVMARFHPHGDSSIYGALVRLAQPWEMRYPLIDFHGNMGNVGGDGPAHYRYTEARLAKFTEDGLLQGLKKRNVRFMRNYDETTEEPMTLPALFPNLLCNPNMGIGWAIACNWAPHNLGEVANAIFAYMDGGTRVSIVTINLMKYEGKAYKLVPNTLNDIEFKVAIPKSVYESYRSYAMVRLNPDGTVSYLTDLDNDPATLTFKTNYFDAYNVYGFVYGAAGAFDAYKPVVQPGIAPVPVAVPIFPAQ